MGPFKKKPGKPYKGISFFEFLERLTKTKEIAKSTSDLRNLGKKALLFEAIVLS